ncbi:MAG: hypothetical protein ACI857_002887 [Arenicella sp.]|jgi:hypothetical protein
MNWRSAFLIYFLFQMNSSFGQHNNYRVAMLLDSNQAELLDSIKAQSFEFAKAFIEKNQTGSVIQCTIKREFKNYGDGPSKARLNKKESNGLDDFLKLFKRETYGYGPKTKKSTGNSILYREMPIAGYTARYLSRKCLFLDGTEKTLCQVESRSQIEDFLLYTIDLDVDKEMCLKDLLFIYQKSLHLGFDKVLTKIRTYKSIQLANSLYDKYYLENTIHYNPKDGNQMLETFCPIDSGRVEMYPTSFLSQLIGDMSETYVVEIAYMTTIFGSNILKDSIPYYHCFVIQAIITNDQETVGKYRSKGVPFSDRYISMAWNLGHHDLSDYMSNIREPDNPFGGTSYRNQGLDKPVPQAYNLLEKIDISKAADTANENLDRFTNYFPRYQKEWNNRISFNRNKDTLTIPLTKKEWKDHKKVHNPEFAIMVSNLSKKVLDFERLPSKRGDKVKIKFAERHLSRVHENKEDQTYLYIEMLSAFEEEALHFESIDLFLMDVDRPLSLTLRFEKMPKQKKK